jgi:multiple sugar transport system ATP-binding protein
MADVRIENAINSHASVQLMSGLEVHINDGEFVVVVGPSGCGKSTLLRMLAGLEPITEGTVSIGGRVVNDVNPKDRNIATVFQNYALYPHKTVYENIAFPLKMAKHRESEIEQKVIDVAKILDISHLLDHYSEQLSGGQRQRVAIGRAIVRNPQVFLFDEPLSNLDAKLRVVMRFEIKQLHQRLGITTIYATHDQIEAMTMADRIVVMRDGRIEQIATPLDLYDYPTNVFVAGYIGSPPINYIHGTIAKVKGKKYFKSKNGLLLPIPDTTAFVGKCVTYGIRPEHIEFGETGIPMEVTLLEPNGPGTRITARYNGDRLNALVNRRIAALPSSMLHFMINPSNAHLFDRETRQRIPTIQ